MFNFFFISGLATESTSCVAHLKGDDRFGNGLGRAQYQSIAALDFMSEKFNDYFMQIG